MDRPDDWTCGVCGHDLGIWQGEPFSWVCTACRSRVMMGPRGRAVPASKELMDLEESWARNEKRWDVGRKPLLVHAYVGRGSPARLVAPGGDEDRIHQGMAILCVWFLGFLCVALRFPLVGLFIAVVGTWALRKAASRMESRARAYRLLEERYEAEKAALRSRAWGLLERD